MPESAHLNLASAEAKGLRRPPGSSAPDLHALHVSATELATNLAWLPGQQTSRPFRRRSRNLSHGLRRLLASLESPPPKTISDDFRWLHDNVRLFEDELEDTLETFELPHKAPHVRAPNGTVIPRIAALAEDFLAVSGYQFGEAGFTCYLWAF